MVTKNSLKNKLRKVLFALGIFVALNLPQMALAQSSYVPNTSSSTGSGICGSLAQSTGGIFSCGTTTTSFTQFNGNLTTPSAGQYGQGIAQNTDLRTYIKNVVNFALGFLGLIAVVVIIYGGFLYVTAAGNEEQAHKGKKALTYAIIGILLILGSFAIVNTVLQAGGSSATNGAAPTGTGGNQNANRQAIFAYAGSAVQTIASNFVTAYQNYSQTNTDFQTMLGTASAFQYINNASDFRTLISEYRNTMQNVVSRAGALSQVAQQGQQALTLMDGFLNQSNAQLNVNSSTNNFWALFGATDYSDFYNNQFIGPFNKLNLTQANDQDFAQAVIKAWNDLLTLRDQIMSASALPNVDQYFNAVLTSLSGLLSTAPTVPPIATAFNGPSTLLNTLVKTALADSPTDTYLISPDKAKGATLANAGSEPGTQAVTNQQILTIVNQLESLYNSVKDLQFVYTVVTADTTDGNAPLLVNVDGLKSLDPNNNNIPDANYSWDFGDPSGTGAYNLQNTATGPTASYVYSKPGTYIIKLTVKAPAAVNGQQQPADGVAYQTITVHPPSSKINLSATIGSNKITLSQFNGSDQIIDQTVLPVTDNEAKAGISFDASQTLLGVGGSSKPITSAQPPAHIHWDFGDKSNPNNALDGDPTNTSLLQPKITYSKAGNYQVVLQVTDEQGITDRQITNVSVNPIIARVQVTPGTTGDLQQEFTFDGSSSASDTSQITQYNWTVTNDKDGSEVTDSSGQPFTPPQTADNFKFTFPDPGNYTVSLTVSDGANTSQPFVSHIQVHAKPPVAVYTFTNSDPTHPNKYVFDGTGSYLPEGTGTLLYKWEANTPPGVCTYYKQDPATGVYNETAGQDCTNLGNEGSQGYSADLGRVEMKFKKGTYKVTLDVQNPNDLGSDVPQEQAVNVTNDLDVGWGDDGSPITQSLAASASGASAVVPFSVVSENGTSYEIDTGDNGKETGPITGGTASATHTYTKAGTYKVKLTVYDNNNNANSVYRNVYIASAGTPVAVITLNENGQIVPDTSTGSTPLYTGDLTTKFTFDASKSLNVDGTGHNLNYSWNFNDGSNPSAQKTVDHTFSNLSDQTPTQEDFNVTLTVSDQGSGKTSAPDTVTIRISRLPPVVNAITAVPVGSNLTTPVQVNITAVGANDPDGKIVSYKWFYYEKGTDPTDPQNQRGVQITTSPNSTLTIGTNGDGGAKKTYNFGVIVTDDAGLKFNSSTLNSSFIPSLDVVNGPNKAPIAKFNVDKTTVNVCTTPSNPQQCDLINFTSASTDPNVGGSIAHYMWDFEGQGYTNPGDPKYDQPNVSYVYTKPNKNGYSVRLKVVNNNGAEAVSDPLTIYVDSLSAPPVASFTTKQLDGTNMQFNNSSTADTANGANLKSYAWDFDVSSDANAVQSTDQNPTYQYPGYGIYLVKLTVTDDQGNSNSVSHFINVKAPAAPAATPPATPPAATSNGPKTASLNGSSRDMSAFVLAGYEVVDWHVLLVSLLAFGIFIGSTLNKKKYDRPKS